MSVILTVGLVANAALAYASVAFIIPSCRRSRFGYELWELRDRVMDEVYDGSFDDGRQARRLVGAIEIVIRGADHLSLLRIWLANLALDEPELPERLRIDVAGLSAADRDRLERHVATFHCLIVRHALFGSISGWLFLLLTRPLDLLRFVRRSVAPRSKRLGRGFEDLSPEEMSVNGRNGVHLEPALRVLSHRAQAKHESPRSRLAG